MPLDGMPDGYRLAIGALAEGIRPPAVLSIWQWADQCVFLPEGTTNKLFQGQYRTDVTPMAREIMECLSPHHPCKEVVAMMSSQLLKTQVGLNYIMYYQVHDPQTELVVYPTLDLAEDWSKDKYTPIALASPKVRGALRENVSRDGGNTILKKSYSGGSMKIAGANTPSSLASRGGAILYCDEVDRYPPSAGVEGDPITIAKRAQITYQDSAKSYYSSTPTIESLSRINKLFKLSDQRYYQVPCPHCDTLQVLKWENFKWDEGQPETAHFVCVENGCIIQERDKVTMLPDEHMGGKAKWIASNPGSKIPGFHGWAAYAPLGMGLSWATLAAMWDECKGDPEKEKAFINIYRGETFRDPTEKLDWEVIKARATRYDMRTIPAGCLVLTAGVDVQGDRIAVQLIGWGRDRIWPGIDYVELPGKPTNRQVWDDLDKLLLTPIVNRFGIPMRARSVVIDTSYLTDEVLKFVRPREHRGVFGGHGSKIQGRQAIGAATKQDRNVKGKQKQAGVKSWLIGTDTIKHALHLWLQADGEVQPEQRRVSFSDQLPDTYFEGFCGEVFDPRKGRWVRIYRQNEPLDTMVYGIAAARHARLRLHLFSDADWSAIEALIEPREQDLFSAAAVQTSALPETPPPAAAPSVAGRRRRVRSRGVQKE